MIKLSNVGISFGDKTIFDKLNLSIYDEEKIGIVGENGCGKSTLVNIISKVIQPDVGKVELFDSTIGYLKQISQYNQEDIDNIVNDSIHYKYFMEILKKNKFLRDIDLCNFDWNSLSGGEKTKLMFAYITALNPSVLILDEPTNHLDVDSIDFIKEYIDSFEGIVIIVSHDRDFLNNTVSKIFEIEKGKVSEYYGNYDDYKEQKALELQTLKAKYDSQKKLEKKIDEEVDTLMRWAQKGENAAGRQGGMRSDSKYKGRKTDAQVSATKLSRSAKSKISRLERQKEDFIEEPYEPGKIHYSLQAGDITSKVLVRLEDLCMGYDNLLFKDVNLTIGKGDKIALVGRNGSGKSTLIKLILKEEKPVSGDVYLSPTLKPEVIYQDIFDLDDNKTIMELAMEGNREYRTKFLTNLCNMNLHREMFNQKIKTLSLGERMRVKLTKMILSDFNFLILDEPTNHLDIQSKEQLEKVLSNFKGSILFTSHDKYFVKNIANKIWTIDDGRINEVEKVMTPSTQNRRK